MPEPDGDQTRAPVVNGDLDRMDSLTLLTAAIRAVDDPDLARRYGRLLLDPDTVESVHPHVADLPGPTAAEVVARARDRFDVATPDARQLVVAATAPPGEQIRRALWLLGVDPTMVAYEAADAEARARRGDQPVSDGTAAITMLVGLVSMALSVFIGKSALTTHHWWLLGLILVAWNGHPAVDLALAGLLWYAADDVTAAVALVTAVIDLAHLRLEQRGALLRTGITLSIRQVRLHVRLRSYTQAPPATMSVRWRRTRRLAVAELQATAESSR